MTAGISSPATTRLLVILMMLPLLLQAPKLHIDGTRSFTDFNEEALKVSQN
jgi:hypothetical protein